jgi:hypothetical protein
MYGTSNKNISENGGKNWRKSVVVVVVVNM